MEKIKIGIITCNRFDNCTGGKCYRAFQKREGAFAIYQNYDAEIAVNSSCGGCPGYSIESVPRELIKNNVTHVHLATGMFVGYPPCPNISYFEKFLKERFGLKIIYGTHPIPQQYFITHNELKSWEGQFWQKAIQHIQCDEQTRLSYD